jgi:spoIIIJ-associated protein
MKKIEAANLQDAYTEASVQLGCSITELDFEIVQNPTKGFLGFFKKSAIIIAQCKKSTVIEPIKEKTIVVEKVESVEITKEPKEEQTPSTKEDVKPVVKDKPKIDDNDPVLADIRAVLDGQKETNNKRVNHFKKQEENYLSEEEANKVVAKIEIDLKALFMHSCYNINIVEVSMHDEKTVKIKFDGEDAALLIGKEGYRYKALSYMLFNWINPKYHLLLRLEIAEFLQNQEEQIHRYLEGVIETVNGEGRAQTKTLDGVLVQIALKELRAKFPQKYVAIRSNSNGEKYIMINEFITRH